MTTSPSPVFPYGAILRRYRLQRNLTLRELGERTGLTPSYISQIERGVVQPSLKVLEDLSAVYRVPVFYFFVDDQPDRLLVRKAERRQMASAGSDARYELLSPTLRRNLEVVSCRLAPGGTTANEPFTHRGEEAVIVLSGTVEVAVGAVQFIIHEGDCIQFEAALPHRYHNIGDVEAEMLLCISPPV